MEVYHIQSVSSCPSLSVLVCPCPPMSVLFHSCWFFLCACLLLCVLGLSLFLLVCSLSVPCLTIVCSLYKTCLFLVQSLSVLCPILVCSLFVYLADFLVPCSLGSKSWTTSHFSSQLQREINMVGLCSFQMLQVHIIR